MIITKDNIHLFDKTVEFDDAVGGGLLIKHAQEIPQEHIDALRIAKADTIGTPMGDFHRVASIPVNVVEEWQREGFDVMKEPVQEVLKRLRKKQVDDFITTTKRI